MKTLIGHLTTVAGAIALVSAFATLTVAVAEAAPGDAAPDTAQGISGVKGSPTETSKATSSYGRAASATVSKGGPSGPEENRSTGPSSPVPEGRDNTGGKKVDASGLVANKKAPEQMSHMSSSRGSPTMPGGVGTGAHAKDKNKGKAPADDK